MAVEEGSFLLINSHTKLFGMNLARVMNLGKEEPSVTDWSFNPPPPLPLDFVIDIPRIDDRDRSSNHVFVFDSKLFVARGGFLNGYQFESFLGYDRLLAKVPLDPNFDEDADYRERIGDMPCCRVYQLDTQNVAFKCPGFHSIPPLPTPFAPCFLGNLISGGVGGDVYCLVYPRSRRPQLEGLWVLRSSPSPSPSPLQHQWERLCSPPRHLPDEDMISYHDASPHCFVALGKLFVEFRSYKTNPHLYCFDPVTMIWMLVDYIRHSLCFKPKVSLIFYQTAAMSLPGLTEGSLVLDCQWKPRCLKMLIHAMLLNSTNGAVSHYQLLEDPFDGMGTILHKYAEYFSICALGNDMVCALLYGYTRTHEYPVLCISVFTLTLNIGTSFDISAETPPVIETKFLDVQVHVKRIFSFMGSEYGHLPLLKPHSFQAKVV